jgi:hypothetical protein
MSLLDTLSLSILHCEQSQNKVIEQC